MKKNLTNLIYLSILSFFVIACSNDDFEEKDYSENMSNKGPQSNSLEDIELKNGVLSFNSIDQFNNTITEINHLDEKDYEEELKLKFETLYERGFVPLYPYYDESDDRRINDFFVARKEVTPEVYNKDWTFEDVLISDDIFASLLNAKREIIIEKVLYKYTFSGLLITKEDDYAILDRYVKDNNLYKIVPNIETLQPGYKLINEHIGIYVSSLRLAPNNNGPFVDCYPDINQNYVRNFDLSLNNNLSPSYGIGNSGLIDWPCGTSYGNGGGYTPSEPEPDHTANMWGYANGLEACHMETQWSPFGSRKVCKDYFTGGKRRTWTLYANEDYLVYKRIKVKVKHQRKRSAPFIGTYWDKKKTSEAAIIINQACFRVKNSDFVAPMPTGFQMPVPGQSKTIMYSDNYIIKTVNNYVSLTKVPVIGDKLPKTPFDEDVIVQFFNDNISLNSNMDIAADQINDLFWSNVWDQTKNAFNTYKGRDPKRVTMIMIDDDYTYVNYVNLTHRKNNVNKYDKIIASDWGFNIKFSLTFSGGKYISTDPDEIANVSMIPHEEVNNPYYYDNGIKSSFKFSAGKLRDFDKIKVDFVGLTRRGDEWRGSKLIYQE
ncbi:hypothetical protein [Mesonia sp.]|uniref:hypothetical protein n=1 Tax=Mesonia sp. TaxID=1960830 RepID=UPI003F96AE71